MPQPSASNKANTSQARHRRVEQLYRAEFNTLEQAFDTIAATAVEVVQARRCSIWLFADDARSLYCVHEYDYRIASEPRVRKNTDEDLLYLAQDNAYMRQLRNGPVVVLDVTSEHDSASIFGGNPREREPCTMLDVPVWVGGRCIGVLCHEGELGRSWSDDERALATRLGSMLALAVEGQRKRDAASRSDRFRALLEQTSESVGLGDGDGRLMYVNPPARRMLGLAPDEPIEGYGLIDFLMPKSAAFMRDTGMLLAMQQGGWTGALDVRGRRGYEFEATVTISVFRAEDGSVSFISCVVRDISGHTRLERRLADTQVQYEAALAQSTDALFHIDVRSGRFKRFTHALCGLLGYTARELETLSIFDIVNDTPGNTWRNVNTVLEEGHAMLGERQYRHKDGHLVDMEVSALLCQDEPRPTFSVHVRDISERQRRRRDVQRLAFRDSCTGLPNSNLLREHADALLDDAWRGAASVAYAIVQIDRWQRVASTLGYEAAELLLQQATDRMQQVIGERPVFIASLQVGGAFGLLFQSTGQQAERLLDEVGQAFMPAFHVDRESVHMSVRSGIAYFPRQAVNFKDLAKRAGLALRRANLEDKVYCVFDAVQAGRRYDDRLLEEDLRRAIGTSQMQLQYQPIVAPRKGDLMVAVEALSVWNHPKEGPVPPNEFIALAENSGLIVAFDSNVLARATQEAAGWLQQRPDCKLSINCSALTLNSPEFIDTLKQVLQDSGVSPAQLCLEITETALMHNLDRAAEAVRDISALGVEIALDDFGTGYSSLAYLKDLIVDVVKIDRDFVRGIGMDVRDERTIETIVSLSRDLGLLVIAEGVETWAQREWLCSRNVDLLQGYYLGRPQTFADLVRSGVARTQTG